MQRQLSQLITYVKAEGVPPTAKVMRRVATGCLVTAGAAWMAGFIWPFASGLHGSGFNRGTEIFMGALVPLLAGMATVHRADKIERRARDRQFCD